MSSFSRGEPDQDNLVARGHEISPFICYEILYPGLVARRSRNSDVLLTISNDAWFGTSAGPHQHFQMARMRAVETGRWLLRGTNNGITALVGPEGAVRARAEQFERTALVGEFRPREGQTPFMRFGDWPALLLALLCILPGAWYRFRGQ
jgi:apolipoprotein N-acyltransferase